MVGSVFIRSVSYYYTLDYRRDNIVVILTGRMVTHRLDFKKDNCYEEVARILIRLVGDSKKVTK